MNDFDEKDLLIRELRERSGDVDGSSIGFHAVRHSARRMQRRRNIVGGAVAAVVATAAVPGGLAVTSALNDGRDPVDGSTIAATPSEATPAPAPTPRPDGTFVMTLDGLTRGEDAQVPYIDYPRAALVTPDGSMGLPTVYQKITRYDDGWLALGYEGDGAEMFLLTDDMEVTRSFPSGDTFVVSDDGSRVVYVQIEDDGTQTLVNAPTDGLDPQTWSLPESPAVQPIGLVDEGSVVYETLAADGTQAVSLATAEGVTELEGFVAGEDAGTTTGLVIGQTRSDMVQGSCWGIMDPAASTTDLVWETCDYWLKSFSPDGRHIAATVPDADGLGAPTLTVLDAESHEPVVEFSNDRKHQSALFQGAWEDDDTVVGIVTEGTTFQLVRYELDGRAEAASDPVEVDPERDDFPLRFATDAW
ncbi:MAG TPA: hypothetical protein VFZ64_06340 [Nocardioidaceae bacterium]